MKTYLGAFAVLTFIFSSGAIADPPAEVMNIVREADIKWVPNPANPGLAIAVVHGDPKVPGQPYVVVVRVRFSPGAFSRPHFHPVDESGQPKK